MSFLSDATGVNVDFNGGGPAGAPTINVQAPTDGSWAGNQMAAAATNLNNYFTNALITQPVRGVKNFARNPGETAANFYNHPMQYAAHDPKQAVENFGEGGGLARAANNTEDERLQEDQTNATAKADSDQHMGMLSSLQGAAQNQVNLYEGNLPSIQERMGNLAAGKIRRNLTEGQDMAKRASQRRGIIGGTPVTRSFDRMRGQAGSDYASQTNDIYDKTNADLASMKDRVAKLGLGVAGMNNSAAEQYYNQALSDLKQKNQSYADLGGAVGRLGTKVYQSGQKNPYYSQES